MPNDKPAGEEAHTMLTFALAAERLVADGLVRSMSAEGLRKLARTDPEWPVGPTEYGQVAGARTLPYERLVDYMRTRSKRTGRGPDKTPRKPRDAASTPDE